MPIIEERIVEKKIDWSKAPEWASKHGLAGPDKLPVWFNAERYEYVENVCGKSYFFAQPFSRSISEISEITERPNLQANSAIKSLEERIKDRAIQRLSHDIEAPMGELLRFAGSQSDKPSGVGELTIRQLIEATGSAIMKHRGPMIADRALNQALDRLADNCEPPLLRITGIMPSSSGK